MLANPRRATWQDPRILMTLLLVFLTGALSGALTMRAGLHDKLHPGSELPIPGTQISYARLKTDLNLTAQQSDSIRMILDDMLKYHQDLQNQIDDVRATGKNRIRAVLNPDQKQHFEQLCKPMQSR